MCMLYSTLYVCIVSMLFLRFINFSFVLFYFISCCRFDFLLGRSMIWTPNLWWWKCGCFCWLFSVNKRIKTPSLLEQPSSTTTTRIYTHTHPLSKHIWCLAKLDHLGYKQRWRNNYILCPLSMQTTQAIQWVNCIIHRALTFHTVPGTWKSHGII